MSRTGRKRVFDESDSRRLIIVRSSPALTDGATRPFRGKRLTLAGAQATSTLIAGTRKPAHPHYYPAFTTLAGLRPSPDLRLSACSRMAVHRPHRTAIVIRFRAA